MGAYASVKTLLNEEGSDIKFSGLLARAASKIGKDLDEGCVLLTVSDVNRIISFMWQEIYSGEFVKNAEWASESSQRNISVQHILHMQGDLEKIRLLIEWLQSPLTDEPKELFFA